jgi:adenylate kinase family enzyme
VKRVTVLGTSGSGKTTVAAALAQRLGVPHVEVDALNHGPNWTEANPEELRRRVEQAIAGHDGWVMDGGHESKLGDFALERADTVVWLDLPLRVTLGRLRRRTSERIHGGVELWGGNRESWRNALVGPRSLFAWAIRSHLRRRRTLPGRPARHPYLAIVRLRSEAEVERWVKAQ